MIPAEDKKEKSPSPAKGKAPSLPKEKTPPPTKQKAPAPSPPKSKEPSPAPAEKPSEAMAEEVLNDVIDDVIKSENSTPSIPAVVLDTFNEVIKSEPTEKETQETSMIIDDDEDSADHRASPIKRKTPEKEKEKTVVAPVKPPSPRVTPSPAPSSVPSTPTSPTSPTSPKPTTPAEANGHVQGDMLESTEVLNRVVPAPQKFEKKRQSQSIPKKPEPGVELRNKDIDPLPRSVS